VEISPFSTPLIRPFDSPLKADPLAVLYVGREYAHAQAYLVRHSTAPDSEGPPRYAGPGEGL